MLNVIETQETVTKILLVSHPLEGRKRHLKVVVIERILRIGRGVKTTPAPRKVNACRDKGTLREVSNISDWEPDYQFPREPRSSRASLTNKSFPMKSFRFSMETALRASHWVDI